MKYEGIKGTAKGKYNEWIELKSAQLGKHINPTNAAGSGQIRENATAINEIIVTKPQDNATAQLFNEAFTTVGKKVTIDFVKDGDLAPYLSIELENTTVSSYNISGHGGENQDLPMESLSLNFTKISYSVTPTTSTKDVKAVKDKAAWNAAVQ